ncbi:hypothetical protein PCC21_004440 [Pectobacterium carotovorum subsp. carotovorum PCC21]|nr:hypothetical protein PCC21_004440 [Pectobacterium carotovorum subsp. carotovorum PCC21]
MHCSTPASMIANSNAENDPRLAIEPETIVTRPAAGAADGVARWTEQGDDDTADDAGQQTDKRRKTAGLRDTEAQRQGNKEDDEPRGDIMSECAQIHGDASCFWA